MGIVLKRRDNAKIVKVIVGGMVNLLLDTENGGVDKALKFLRKSVNDLLKGNYPVRYFTTTKTLRGTYKGDKLSTTKKGKKETGYCKQWTKSKP